MAKQIIWSARAKKDRALILEYWDSRNGSKRYSRKLNTLFSKAIKIIQEFPGIGRPTTDKKARIKVVKHYLIIYEDGLDAIHILTIRDSRRELQEK